MKKAQLNLEEKRLQNKNINKALKKEGKAYSKFKKICDKNQFISRSRILADKRNEKIRKVVRDIKSFLLKPFGLNISKKVKKSWKNVEVAQTDYLNKQKKHNTAVKQYTQAKRAVIETEQNLLQIQKMMDKAKSTLIQFRKNV